MKSFVEMEEFADGGTQEFTPQCTQKALPECTNYHHFYKLLVYLKGEKICNRYGKCSVGVSIKDTF